MTQRIFYEDSHRREFTARVLSCQPEGNGFSVVLNRTAFFPEGGGQPGDTGWLSGVPVTDTRERDGLICHFTERSMEAGTEVSGVINWDRRFRFMQNHSGEHVVSGLTHRLFGYDNTGFHMSGPVVTIDFNGELTSEQIAEIEDHANAVVFANKAIRTYFPKPEILETLNYRSKLNLTENVRLVEIEDCDLCACCAPHVRYTGEIGLIKILSSMRHRGGMRLTLSCGYNALVDYRLRQISDEACSALLSAPLAGIVPAVERLQKELAEVRGANAALKRRALEAAAFKLEATDGNLLIFEEGLEAGDMRELVNKGTEKCGRICAVFSGSDAEGYTYVMGSRSCNLRELSKAINEGLEGRGGGSPTMIQGSCRADRATIERVMNGIISAE